MLSHGLSDRFPPRRISTGVVPFLLRSSGSKCACDLERELVELRIGCDFQACTNCHNYVAFVRLESFDELEHFRVFQSAFWADAS
jgi:hypothetical protein